MHSHVTRNSYWRPLHSWYDRNDDPRCLQDFKRVKPVPPLIKSTPEKQLPWPKVSLSDDLADYLNSAWVPDEEDDLDDPDDAEYVPAPDII